MTVSNLYSDGTNTNITGIINPKNMVDQGSSQKDNHKNTDSNNANDVISKNKDGQQTKFIDFSTFSSEDVTAYVVFKHFKYKRGRQDSHQDYVAKDDEGFLAISSALGSAPSVLPFSSPSPRYFIVGNPLMPAVSGVA